MSSENEVPVGSVSLEEFMRTRPQIILGFAISSPGENHNHNQQMMMILGSGDVDSMLSELLNKNGPLPATKASIEALPAVKITEEKAKEECSICLTEYEAGDEAKVMPCKHTYHSGCIDKWLGIHGSCPVCRYKMPVDEEGSKKERVGGIWVLVGRYARTDSVSDSDSSPPRNDETGSN